MGSSNSTDNKTINTEYNKNRQNNINMKKDQPTRCMNINEFWKYIGTNIDINNIKNSDKIYIQHVVTVVLGKSCIPNITDPAIMHLFSNKLFQCKILNHYMRYNKQCIDAIIIYFNKISEEYLITGNYPKSLWCATESPIMPILSATSTHNKLHIYPSVILGRRYTSREYLCAYNTFESYYNSNDLNMRELEEYIRTYSKINDSEAYKKNECNKPFYVRLEIKFNENYKGKVYKYNNKYIICPPYNIDVVKCFSPKGEGFKNACPRYMYGVYIGNV
jgi:hypothetical protein